MSKSDTHTVPARSEVAQADTWDLSDLFADDAAWEAGLAELEAGIPKVEEFKGTLGESAERWPRPWSTP
jgi:oligoendopeptidase F